jgi:hypothetical protein
VYYRFEVLMDKGQILIQYVPTLVHFMNESYILVTKKDCSGNS